VVFRKALIYGITGQDGSYLAELLLGMDYEVHGVVRSSSQRNTQRISHLQTSVNSIGGKLILHPGDLSDSSSIFGLVSTIRPDEIYNLAAQSHVRKSFDQPELTGNITGLASTRILEAIRTTSPHSKYLQASSSEMFGTTPAPQNESSYFAPRSPYAIAKLSAYWTTKNYAEAYGLFASNAIMFNHESPRRGEDFVTRKITLAAARIKHGLQSKLLLGNLDARRDFGYAPEYVRGIWLAMQQSKPEDFVFATGESHSVREFLNEVFSLSGLSWQDHVVFDETLIRPTEVEDLRGDASKALNKLGWTAETKFQELASLMLESDMSLIEQNQNTKIDVPRFTKKTM
jgi:GDPmannose 4,6-dehydratase